VLHLGVITWTPYRSARRRARSDQPRSGALTAEVAAYSDTIASARAIVPLKLIMGSS
jgi:hypothetical protein